MDILREKIRAADSIVEDEATAAFAKGEVQRAGEKILLFFPELGPTVAEFGLTIHQERQAGRIDRRKRREPLH